MVGESDAADAVLGGKPLASEVNRTQVAPPSMDSKTPLPGPPSVKSHARRVRSQRAT